MSHAQLGTWWGTQASRHFAEQFEHVEWEGFRFYDLIFPLFLFLVGVVLPFSLRKYQARPVQKSRLSAALHAGRFCCSFWGWSITTCCNSTSNSQRYAGVLQRIAICYAIAAVILLLTRVRTQALLLIAILLSYWAIMTYVPSPESHAGDLTKKTNLAGYLDRHYLPGKIYQSYYGFGDNEGLLSTIPAVATALLGVLAGQWLISNRGRWIKARWPCTRWSRLSRNRNLGKQSFSDHQNPLDQHLRLGGGWVESAPARVVLHDHRCHQFAILGLFLRRDRR